VPLRLAAAIITGFIAASVAPHARAEASQARVALSSPAPKRLALFRTEPAAQAHCPGDTVIWLNTESAIYHLKGEKWYGRTKHGAYVCKKEAGAAGDQETRNGQ